MRACPGAASAFIAKATHSALVHATSRSLSTRRNHWSSWFQLAKIWVTDNCYDNFVSADDPVEARMLTSIDKGGLNPGVLTRGLGFQSGTPRRRSAWLISQPS